MIRFTRSSNTVIIEVETGLNANGGRIKFEYHCESSQEAELLHDKLWRDFDSRVTQIREKEYRRGWKRKGKRVTKADERGNFFYGTLTLDSYHKSLE